MHITARLCLIAAALLLTGCVTKYTQVGQIVQHDPAADEFLSTSTGAEFLDDMFRKGTALEKLCGGFEWAEGPVWVKSGDYLLFSDVPTNSVFIWSEGWLDAKVYIHPSGYTASQPRSGEMGSNGLAVEAGGRIVLCQHGDRRIARWSPVDKQFVTVVDNYQGKKFNSPNDLVFARNGDLYFTDPPYGLELGMRDPNKELPFQGVYLLRSGEPGGELVLLTDQMSRPNGIGLSPDEKTLYVANSDGANPVIMSFPIKDDGTIGEGRVFFDCKKLIESGKQGAPDGMAVDQLGNVWATGPGGVLLLSPGGRLLASISTTRRTANCAFGGEDGDILFITADDYLLRLKTKVRGIGFQPN